MRNIPNTNEIKAYMHCGLCQREDLPEGQSPADAQRISVGWTPLGLQVWCDKHNVNIIHVDFEGQKHPANTTAKRPS